MFEHGYEALYTPRSYGKGVTPDTFIDYKKQRYRRVYGAMQILRRHARGLLTGAGSGLNAGQRYHFVAGWLPWIADGVNFFFTLAALACLGGGAAVRPRAHRSADGDPRPAAARAVRLQARQAAASVPPRRRRRLARDRGRRARRPWPVAYHRQSGHPRRHHAQPFIARPR